MNASRKTALVTGGNKGIGFEVARELGKAGYSVWLGCRDEGRGQASAAKLREEGIDAHVLVLDVSSDASVAGAAEKLAGQIDALDALVNNAGIVLDREWRPSEIPLDVMRATYETNVFGPLRVTQACAGLLRKAKAGRVVNVSSSMGSLAQVADPACPFYGVNFVGYNSSKSALNAVTVALAKDLVGDGIKVNIADPGHTATDFNNHAGPRSTAQAAKIIVEMATLGEDGPIAGYFNDAGRVPW